MTGRAKVSSSSGATKSSATVGSAKTTDFGSAAPGFTARPLVPPPRPHLRVLDGLHRCQSCRNWRLGLARTGKRDS
eukprot:1112919-Prorocentrum_lima.AAC.1